jgi:DNA-directed RNA polymerase specialized sigma24 family protein
MTREEQFDSFYLATRQQLVHQAFALTGDLPAAQSAVRDSYIAAWHHWRKVSAMDDPSDWVRPRAWQLAQRRHAARIWHRSKGLSEEVAAVLEAVAKLSFVQRRTLLLTQLAGVPLPQAARELNLTQQAAERHLQSATANVAVALDTDSSAIRSVLLSLASVAGETRLPRASIIRRAGRKRRRAHTAVAAAAATVAVIASGAFAYQPSKVQATTDAHLVNPQVTSTVEPVVVSEEPTGERLLDEHQIARLGLAQDWDVKRTHDNTTGDGINTICQKARFADPDGISAAVREFEAAGKPSRSAVQTVEVSKSADQAEKAFSTTVGWYAGCHVARLQLLRAYQVDGIGDQAHVLLVRVWEKPVTTYSVAVARIGSVVTSTVGETVGDAPPPPREVAQSLADAVAMLCATSGAEDCSSRPTTSVVPPPPSGEEPGILAVADLPPVGRVDEPWVGTDARPARVNPSATTCDRADFDSAGAVRTRSRTFLIPGADLPDRFGLSETYGVFDSPRAAARFLDTLRKRLSACEDRDLATTVMNGRSDRVADMELSTWDLETEISDNESVLFRLGLVRVGRKVAQVNFSPSPREDMTGSGFHELVERAGDRLRELS